MYLFFISNTEYYLMKMFHLTQLELIVFACLISNLLLIFKRQRLRPYLNIYVGILLFIREAQISTLLCANNTLNYSRIEEVGNGYAESGQVYLTTGLRATGLRSYGATDNHTHNILSPLKETFVPIFYILIFLFALAMLCLHRLLVDW